MKMPPQLNKYLLNDNLITHMNAADRRRFQGVRGNERVRRFNRLIFYCSSIFCNIDLKFSSWSECPKSTKHQLKVYRRSTVRGSTSRPCPMKQRQTHWLWATSFLFVLIMLHIAHNLLYHYEHDYYVYHIGILDGKIPMPEQLARHYRVLMGNSSHLLFESGHQGINNNNSIATITRRWLAGKLEESEMQLEEIGMVPIMKFAREMPFVIPSYYLQFLVVCFLGYLLGVIYFRFFGTFESSFVRVIENPRSEMDNLNMLICNQINLHLLESSKLLEFPPLDCRPLVNNQWQSINDDCSALKKVVEEENCDDGDEEKEAINCVRGHQERLACMWKDFRRCSSSLKHLALSGRFQYIGASNKWTDKLSLFCTIFSICAYVAIVACHMVLIYLSSASNQLAFKPMDLIVSFEIVFVWFVVSVVSVFHLTLDTVVIFDQIHLIWRLIKEMDACLRGNGKLCARIVRANWNQNFGGLCEAPKYGQTTIYTKKLRHKINKNLLSVMINYRIFTAQLLTVHSFTGYVSLWSVVLMFVNPINLLLHAPYISNNSMVSFICSAVACVLFADFCLVPTCYLSGLCTKKLYNKFSALLAHVIETTHTTQIATSDTSGAPLYYEHSLLAMRLEMAHPGEFVRRLQARPLGFAVSYPAVIRCHFFVGALILSVCSNYTEQSVLANLLADPLGLNKIASVQ